tara:strand:- start:6472 stop:6873 length:402 start_codon:yes stop_codon:yes gene_type:complete
MHELILYDGICKFCNSWIKLVSKYDHLDKFRLAHLQSEIAKNTLKEFNIINADINTIYVINEKKELLTKFKASTYVMKECMPLTYPLYLLNFLFPKFILNFFYDLVGRNRYKIFGKTSICEIPSGVNKSKFLD